MRIKYEGQWITVSEQTADYSSAHKMKNNSEPGNSFAPYSSSGSSSTRGKALTVLAELEKAAGNKNKPKSERFEALRIASTFYKSVGDVDKQLESAKKILEFSKSSGDYYRLGEAYSFAGQIRRAAECFERAVKLPHKDDPLVDNAYTSALFQVGMRWEEAGHYHALHDKHPEHPQGLFKHWQGEACETATLMGVGGYGDLFFWSRFLPLIGRVVKRPIFLVPRTTQKKTDDVHLLLQRQGFEVVDEDANLGTPPVPLIMPGKSLIATYLTLTPGCDALKTIPNLLADPDLAKKYSYLRAGMKPTVGFCRRAGAEEIGGARPGIYRQLTDEQAVKIIEETKDTINWVNLLYQDSRIHESMNMPEIRDWNDTAAVIENLDLVVTVDTGVAHLAGAMGKPTWVLLGGDVDWRYPVGEVNPFYPAMKQIQNNGWGFENAVEIAISELQKLPFQKEPVKK